MDQLSLFEITDEVQEVPVIEMKPDPPEVEKEYLKTSKVIPAFFEKNPANPFLWYWLHIKGIQPGDMVSLTEAQKWLESEVEELRMNEGLRFDDMTISIHEWKEKLEEQITKKWGKK